MNERAIEPDGEAFETFYRREYLFVHRCIVGFGVDRALAEDAVQDVFITAMRRAGSFDGRSSRRAWLAGIARRIAYRYRRTRARRQRCEQALAAVQRHEASRSGAYERVDFLRRFLSRLDRSKREAFVLMELEGFTGSEAAQSIGANRFTLYARLRAARAELARTLERNERLRAGLERQLAGRRRLPPRGERLRRTTALVAVRWIETVAAALPIAKVPAGLVVAVAALAVVATVMIDPGDGGPPPRAGLPAVSHASAPEAPERTPRAPRRPTASATLDDDSTPVTPPRVESPTQMPGLRPARRSVAVRRDDGSEGAVAGEPAAGVTGLAIQLEILEAAQRQLGREDWAGATQRLSTYWNLQDRVMDQDAAVLTATAYCALGQRVRAGALLGLHLGQRAAHRTIARCCGDAADAERGDGATHRGDGSS